VFIARNHEPSHAKGELDLVGFDGETLAFVEVRTRELASGKTALPELSITRGKHKVLLRFDVVAIDNSPGRLPVVRLHKDALSPRT
jgi:Holliday junction resolvase-like predicted endonuclease